MNPGNQVAYVICYVELGKNENHDGDIVYKKNDNKEA